MARTWVRKAVRDLRQSRGRTLLAVAAITVGVAAAGSILSAFSVITRESTANFDSTNPPAAVLRLARPASGSDAGEIVEAAEAHPDVVAAELRGSVTVRLVDVNGRRAGGGAETGWVPFELVVVTDFADLRVARFFPDTDVFAPTANEIVVERSSLDEVDVAVGDRLQLSRSNAGGSLTVAGLVHDPGRTPAWMAGRPVGYVTLDALAGLGISGDVNDLLLSTAGDRDREENRSVAEAVAADLEESGVEVARVGVPVPGEHPADRVVVTMLFILQALGSVAMLAAAAIVATLITAQLKQQRREIGVMKGIGGTTWHIARIYLASVGVVTVAGLAIGVPLGLLGGRAFVDFAFGLLNFEVASYAAAGWVFPTLVGAALAVATAAVAHPIAVAARRPVREVVTDLGIAAGAIRKTQRSPRSQPVRWGTTVVFGARNAFRTRARTFTAAATIAIGGAAFMVAFNTGAAWERAVDAEFQTRNFGYEVRLDDRYPAATTIDALSRVAGIESVEAWNEYRASIHLASGGPGDAFRLLVPPVVSNVIDLPILEGRWLAAGDRRSVVVTQTVDDPAPQVGSVATLEIGGATSKWTVVGIARQLSGGATGVAYASDNPGDAPIATSQDTTNVVRLVTEGSAVGGEAIEDALTRAGIGVAGISTADDGRRALDDHLLIIMGLLLVMAILIAVVGGLGLVETMSVTVLERRRELGVMRAVGGTTGKVLSVVTAEAAVIAALSWCGAVVLSVPATLVVESVAGNLFTQAPLDPVFSPGAAGLWLAAVTLLATVAAAIPAMETVEVPVHRALAYE